MNFIGHTRYSLFKPGSTKWRATNGSKYNNEQDYKNYLFSDERLSIRSEMFLSRSLPALALAAEGYNYKHVVSYSKDLPTRYKQELESAAEKFGFLKLDEQGPDDVGIDLNEFALSLFGLNNPYGVFRLDDDDVLAKNFFGKMSPYIRKEFSGMQVSMPLGFTGIVENGKYRNIAQMYSPLIALGLLGVHFWDKDGQLISPKWVSHPKSDRANPVIFDARNAVYFRGLHIGNDTGITRDGTSSIQAAYKELSRYRSLTSEELDLFKKDFPTLGERVPSTSERVLFEGVSLLDDELHFQFPRAVSSFTIDAHLRFSAHPGKLNSLFRFDLRDSSGDIVKDRELNVIGLGRSKSPKAGYFRYIYSQAGPVTTRGEIELPPGITCDAVTLVRWGNKDTNVLLERLSIHTEKN